MKMKKQVYIGLLSILIAGGLDPLVGICQTSGIKESSRVLNEVVQKKSGEEKLPEGTSITADSITYSQAEDTKTIISKDDVSPESSEEPVLSQKKLSSQAGESSSEIKEDIANPTTSETVINGETDEQTVQAKDIENIDDWMPDKNFQTAIASALNMHVSQITKNDMLKLRGLNIKNVNNLTGIEYATNMRRLILFDSSISDVSLLQHLTNLTYLSLYRNQISDVSPLQNLTQLTSLNLFNNQISDIGPLQNLTQLTSLNLFNNQISDISPLQNLTQLTSLNLFNNQISDISPLQNLTQLTSLNLFNNQISDIGPLQNLSNLINLSLSRNQIFDVSPLQYLNNLIYLSLFNNQISDVSSLQHLNNLIYLNLFNNQISNVDPLQNLTNLTNLNLFNNQISDVRPLQNLANLTNLELSNNEISDISSLTNLTARIYAQNQTVVLPVVYISSKKPYSISVENPIMGVNSKETLFPQNNSYWTGVYNSGKVEWAGGEQVSQTGNLKTSWASDDGKVNFSGTYEQPYILSKTTVDAHDSTLHIGENWNAQDNFDGAKDKEGNPVNFQEVQVTGTVDTTQSGKYKVTYSYGGVQKEIEVTVLQKLVSSGNDNIVNGGNKEQNQKTTSSLRTSNVSQCLTSSESERNSLPLTGEKGSVWLLISGVMLFIFASAIALLSLKKSK